jgi:hypothetical protein
MVARLTTPMPNNMKKMISGIDLLLNPYRLPW